MGTRQITTNKHHIVKDDNNDNDNVHNACGLVMSQVCARQALAIQTGWLCTKVVHTYT